MMHRTFVPRNILNTTRATHSWYLEYFAKYACNFLNSLLQLGKRGFVPQRYLNPVYECFSKCKETIINGTILINITQYLKASHYSD